MTLLLPILFVVAILAEVFSIYVNIKSKNKRGLIINLISLILGFIIIFFGHNFFY